MSVVARWTKVGCAIGEWERHGHGKKTYRFSAARGRKGGMSALDSAWFVGLLAKFSLTLTFDFDRYLLALRLVVT